MTTNDKYPDSPLLPDSLESRIVRTDPSEYTKLEHFSAKSDPALIPATLTTTQRHILISSLDRKSLVNHIRSMFDGSFEGPEIMETCHKCRAEFAGNPCIVCNHKDRNRPISGFTPDKLTVFCLQCGDEIQPLQGDICVSCKTEGY